MIDDNPVSLENEKCPVCKNENADPTYILNGYHIENGVDLSNRGFHIAFCKKCFERFLWIAEDETAYVKMLGLFDSDDTDKFMNALNKDPSLQSLLLGTVMPQWVLGRLHK